MADGLTAAAGSTSATLAAEPEDAPGALWSHAQLGKLRVAAAPRELARVAIAVDPAVSCGENSDETGICVVARGENGEGYVLADRSGRYSPHRWGEVVICLYHEYRAKEKTTEKGGPVAFEVEARRWKAPVLCFTY